MAMSRLKSPACHRPWPLTWPAGPAALASCSSKCSIVSRSGWCGVAWPLNTRLATGRRCASQLPASRLSRLMWAWAAWSRPLLCTWAWPLSRVCGQPGTSAARSSDRVARVSAPSGQRSKGSSRACALRLGAAAPGAAVGCSRPARPRSASRPCKGPASRNWPAQGLLPPWRASRVAATTIGAALAMRAAPLTRVCRQVKASSCARCSAPWPRPRPSWAVRSVMAGCWSISNWPILSLSICSVSGSRRSAGACSRASVAGPLRQTTRCAVTSGRCRLSQAPGKGRQPGASNCSVKPSTSNCPPPAWPGSAVGCCQRSVSTCSWPLPSVPCTPCSDSPGTRSSNQGSAAGWWFRPHHSASGVSSSSAASASRVARSQRRRRRAGAVGGAGGWSVRLAAAGPGSGGWGSSAIRRRCRPKNAGAAGAAHRPRPDRP